MSRRNSYVLIIVLLCSVSLHAGPLSLGGFTQVKLEYQYTDYGKYTYPNPILYEYPNQQYLQPLPYIVDFPENRGLVKVTQSLGINDELQIKYQYAELDRNNYQDLAHIKYVRNLSAFADAHLSAQLTRGSGGFLGRMVELGGKVDWAGFVLLSGSYAYYSNELDTAGSVGNDAHALEFKLRQALTRSTALQVRHNYFFASVKKADFASNTLTFWLSQFFPSKTALHLEWREHWDTTRLRASAPALEIDQYLSWATILTLRGRYYYGKPSEPAVLETIKGNHFESYSFSAILSLYVFAETTVMLKYRYYWSDQDIQMNTYLLGLQHIL